MINKPAGDDEKLGHDPLEWLAEEQDETDVEQVPQAEVAEPVDVQESPSDSQEAVADESTEQPISEVMNEAELTEACFVLPERLTVQHVEQVYADLSGVVGALLADSTLELDASDLGTIDSSGFQLLLSTLKSCQAKSCQLSVKNLGESARSQLALLGDEQICQSAGVSQVEG